MTKSGNQAFTFLDGGARLEKAGTLYYHGGLLWADTNGDGQSDFQVTIAGKIDLSAGDFLL